MNEKNLKKLEEAVTEIAYRYEQTKKSHSRLQKEHASLIEERNRLLDHNRLATDKIESMINRLKQMEQQHD